MKGYSYNSFKLGYSRGLPTYLALKVFNNKRDEEYFVTSLYCRILLHNGVQVVNWQNCDDDTNKGPDTLVTIKDGIIPIQVTRFTLTNYLQRKNSAQRRIENIIQEILKIAKIPIPLNITIYPPSIDGVPIRKPYLDSLLAREIVGAIKKNIAVLVRSQEYVSHVPTDSNVRKVARHIVLQSIPSGFFSNFYGRNNIFINYDFDNIGYSEKDLDDEAQEIFKKKNGGKACILLIWAETFETLYSPQRFAEKLRKYFSESTFEQVIFFCFDNRADMFLDWNLKTTVIKDVNLTF